MLFSFKFIYNEVQSFIIVIEVSGCFFMVLKEDTINQTILAPF